MNVYIIFKNDADSSNSTSKFAAVARDIPAAMKWIQDEVDGKHENGNRYAKGKDAQWWINNGWFSLKMVSIHGA